MISIVLPCFNEMRHGYLPHILENLTQQQGAKQIIAVVSPSSDGTRELIAQYPSVNIVETTAHNRAQRLNVGIQAATGDLVLLHHPATLLPAQQALAMIQALMANDAIVWGGFQHSFDLDHWLLRFTSWYSNRVRSQSARVLYLDHCIFARRSALEAIGGVPDMDIFEDTALSHALGRLSMPALAAGKVVTSARRFRERGIYRHAFLNQALKVMYHSRLDPKYLNWLYEKRAQINVGYEVNDSLKSTGIDPEPAEMADI
jgi:glycosyltransferase involved in cell wall biosynthesis